MMQISKVSSSNEPGTENLLLGASIILATRSQCDSIIPATRSRYDAGMMLSHRLPVAGMMLAPKSKCSVPGSFENETLLICIRVF